MKKHQLFFILCFTIAMYKINAQTQFGFFANATSTSLKSDNFDKISNGTGFSLGISSLSYVSDNSDFIVELDYGVKKITVDGYKNYYGVNTSIKGITINNVSVSMLYNQYIIVPDVNKFHFGILAGLGSTVLNKWKGKEIEEDIFEGVGNLKPFYILGISGGTEQLRISLRYNQLFGNAISNAFITSNPDKNSMTQEVSLDGKLNFFSLGITWYFKNFLDNE